MTVSDRLIFGFIAKARTLVGLLLFVAVFSLSLVYTYTRGNDSSTVYAATSSTLNFQGRLYQASGSVVPDGTYNIEFKLYDGGTDGGPAGTGQPNSGSLLWTETRDYAGTDDRVRVQNGYFTVNLGSVNPFGASIKWDQELWITMAVRGSAQCDFATTCTPADGEMLAPGNQRTKLTAVPYAFRAGSAVQLLEEQLNGTGTLEFLALTQNRTISLPDADGTVLLNSTGFANGGNSFGASATLGTGDTNDLIFTTDGSERLRIDQVGNVSIGTSADGAEKLDVNGGIRLGNTSNTNAGTIRWNGTDFEGYDGISWKSLTLSGTLSVNPTANVRKAADETENITVNATAALQDDDELLFAIGANETWNFRFVITANANATPDIKFAVSAPGGATCRVGVQDAEGATTVGNLACGVSSGLVPGNTAEDVYEVTGTVVNGATPGNVRLRWAQNTANALNTIVRQGSYLTANRIAGPGQTSQAFIQSGNAFGTTATLGTTDSQALSFITAGNEALRISSTGQGSFTNGLTVGNLLQITAGGIDNNSGGIIDVGSLAGVTTISASGAISAATATDTINGLVINSGSLSSIAGFTQSSGNFSFSNNGGTFAVDSSGLDITSGGALSSVAGFTQSSGNFSFSNAAGNFTLDSAGLDITSGGALSGITTLAASGAITAATATDTINGLVVNSGALSSITGFTQASGNFAQSGTGSFSTGSGAVSLNGATTISTATNSATALTVNGTTGTAATALNIAQSGNAANLAMTNTAMTSGALVSLTQNTSAFTGTGLLINMASGSGSFASGNFINLQLNGVSRFRVDNTGALLISSDNTAGLNVQSTGGLSYFSVNTTGGQVQIGSAVADGTGVLLVLDTKNTATDPTGVNGASYYNSADSKARCYENGVWTDCNTTIMVGETTLGAANATINVNLSRSTEYLRCRVDIKSRSGSAIPYLRFNNDVGVAAYGWNIYGITGIAVVDAQDASDSELQLATAGSTVPFTASVEVTDFTDTRKAVSWTGIGAEAIGAQMNRFSGGGTWENTTAQISSVQFIASTGTFAAGSHAWCEGRDIR